ncbi:glucose-1-phosphate adenylyltransferase [bacterium]|nr:glucose-1-phosphate adenylyltransferase [candidate division CSSED10-310 bacterium]
MSTSYLLPRDTLGLILAGGRVNELAALTLHRPKSAMPFGGMYRVIDCALTNLAHAGIDRIGILSQYRPSSLMDHVRDGKYWDFQGFQRGVSFLPPHTGDSDSDWYKGTADALYQNIAFLQHYRKPLTLVVSGDHMYRMDYRALFDVHIRTGVHMTMAVTRVPMARASRFGLADVAGDGRVRAYREKPVLPFSDLASMTVYLFNTDVLLEELRQNARTGVTFQIYDEILPRMVDRGVVSACIYEGYWAYSRTLEDYYQANMDCLGDQPPVDLSQWKLSTNMDAGRIGDPCPILIGPDACITESIVSPGCRINGVVHRSVLSPDCVIETGARIDHSVVMEGSRVGSGSSVHRAIIDKHVRVGCGTDIGCAANSASSAEPNREIPDLLSCGLSVIGKRVTIPGGITIGTNVIIYPDVDSTSLAFPGLPDGSTVFPV